LRYLPTIIITLLIVVAVTLPGSQIPDLQIFGIDKVVHFILFSVWTLAVRRDYGPSFRWPVALLTGLVFSLVTEMLQIAVEGRTFDWTDLVADAVGLVTGLLIGRIVLRWLSRFVRM
jgi:VanZ family protein